LFERVVAHHEQIVMHIGGVSVSGGVETMMGLKTIEQVRHRSCQVFAAHFTRDGPDML
jgi:hypothetical protein